MQFVCKASPCTCLALQERKEKKRERGYSLRIDCQLNMKKKLVDCLFNVKKKWSTGFQLLLLFDNSFPGDVNKHTIKILYKGKRREVP